MWTESEKQVIEEWKDYGVEIEKYTSDLLATGESVTGIPKRPKSSLQSLFKNNKKKHLC